MAAQCGFDRSHLAYDLVVRQEPKQARMCGVGGKADRRPIDPPPIVQLRVIHPSLQAGTSVPSSSKPRRDTSAESDSDSPRPFADDVADASTYAQSFLQNPYYFMFACLARPDDDAELHWLKDGRTRCTTGSVVSSLYHLKDPQNNNEDAGFFVFPDLSVRTEGSYRLKLSLFEVVGNNVHHCKSIYSAPFYVYTAKKFPGMEESTPLSCSLADQGIKIRIRKDIRVRKRQIPALTQPLSTDIDGLDSDGEDEDDPDRRPRRQTKRSRIDNSADASGSGLGAISQQLPWPAAASINPNIPPAAVPNALPASSEVIIPPPQKPAKEMQPTNGITMGVHVSPGNSLPGPSVFDGRGGGIIQMDSPQQPGLSNPQKSPQTSNSTTQYRESNPVNGAASSSPQLSASSHQSHPQYPTPQSPVAAAPAPPQQQQVLQPQHQPSTTLANANGPPQSATHPPSTHGPPPTMQHQPPQHPQHMQHPQAGTYAPSPYPQWGPSAPMAAPTQQAVYDPYYHHQQHNHYATYAPPPQQSMPPPPARYDYGTGMYTHAQAPPPPPAMASYGYYDQHQHQQHHQPPHHPQQQMMPPHPHSYPQHQVHPPPPMHQYAPPPPAAVSAPTSNNTNSAVGTPAPMVTDTAQIGNGTNGATSTHPPPPNFASASGVAAPSAQAPAVAQYDYSVVYNNRPPAESAAGRGGYGAPTPAPTQAQYGMTPMHSAPIPAPHPAHPQSYPMHAAGAPPHSVTPMRHSPYGPPPHHHPHPAYSYTPYSAPPPPAPEWGAQGFVTNHHQHGWDAYAHHPQQQQQQQHPQQQQQQQQQGHHVPMGQPQPHTPVAVAAAASSSAMVTANAVVVVDQAQAHRIQLAPIPSAENNGHNATNNNNHAPSPSSMHHSPVRASSSSNPSPPSMRGSSGGGSSGGNNNGRVTTMSNAVGGGGERMDDGVHGYRHIQGKKNPLSIGSIISNDAR